MTELDGKAMAEFVMAIAEELVVPYPMNALDFANMERAIKELIRENDQFEQDLLERDKEIADLEEEIGDLVEEHEP